MIAFIASLVFASVLIGLVVLLVIKEHPVSAFFVGLISLYLGLAAISFGSMMYGSETGLILP